MEQTVNVNEVSRISSGTAIKGEINSPNDIRIDGIFEGKIISKGRVVVGDKAVISGDIICENVDFWGKMTGNLFVKDTLSLKEGCSIRGDLRIRRLIVELGANFDGNCKMIAEGDFDKVAGASSSTAKISVNPVPSDAETKIGGTPVK
ncbi:MAG: polymer-forming cytoskeletal protein [Bacteroidales bacterium]|nr:polymer-forming cytoskeletal protein [Bacteroidales bacterium]MBR0240763.1 polymer-forming cytoskeletal protein [Bacteroidales bacterium]MBR0298096.1 polymer-forming cytoskeletal protein [Bacteroidales bacterium]